MSQSKKKKRNRNRERRRQQEAILLATPADVLEVSVFNLLTHPDRPSLDELGRWISTQADSPCPTRRWAFTFAASRPPESIHPAVRSFFCNARSQGLTQITFYLP
jgi:hypothetical protein